MSAPVKFNANNDSSKFDVAYVTTNLIGTGLALFVALQWQSALKNMTDVWNEPESKTERHQQSKTKRILQPMGIAAGSTGFAVGVTYVLFKYYQRKNR